MKNQPIYKVTTEADCEGRTMKTLGYFVGEIDEIALFLADKCAYELKFEIVEPIEAGKPTGNTVKVCLDYFINPNYVKNYSVNYSNSCGYYGVISTVTPEDKDEILRKETLDSLTHDQQRVLGLI